MVAPIATFYRSHSTQLQGKAIIQTKECQACRLSRLSTDHETRHRYFLANAKIRPTNFPPHPCTALWSAYNRQAFNCVYFPGRAASLQEFSNIFQMGAALRGRSSNYQHLRRRDETPASVLSAQRKYWHRKHRGMGTLLLAFVLHFVVRGILPGPLDDGDST